MAVDVASAEASLRGAGVNLPKLALDKSLTEGDMTSISSALGVAVTTAAAVAADQRGAAEHVHGELRQPDRRAQRQQGPAARQTNFDPASDNGHGKKKGHSKHTQEPQ